MGPATSVLDVSTSRGPASRSSIPRRANAIPASPGNVLVRPQLAERIHDGLARRLLLVTGPAGYGKTTAIAEILRSRADVAWLSLDEADRSPWRLQDHLLATLEEVTAPAPVQASPTRHPRDALAVVRRQLTTLTSPLVLVLDDAADVLRGASAGLVGRLLEWLPADIHVVVISRRRPPLDIERRRARGEITEVPGQELAFDRLDVANYLNGVWGLDLPGVVVDELATASLGWPLALRLTAEHLAHTSDPAVAARGIATAEDLVLGPLVRELLDGLGPSDRRMAVDIAILDALDPAVWEQLSGQADAVDRLARLAELGLVVPASHTPRAYRHHPLVHPLLLEELRRSDGRAAALHRAAATVLVGRGDRRQAVEQAIAAGDTAHALAWLADELSDPPGAIAAAAFAEVVARLTVPVIAQHPRVLGTYVDFAMAAGDRDELEATLGVLEGASRPAAPWRAEALHRVHAYLARLRGDGVEPLQARRSSQRLDLEMGLPLGGALAAEGRHEAASVAFRRALEDARRQQEPIRELVILADAAWQRATAGHLVDADLLVRRTTERAAMLGLEAPPLSAQLASAQVALDRGLLAAARDQAAKVRALAAGRHDLVMWVESGLLRSRALWATDDLDRAVQVVEDTDRALRHHLPGGGLASRLVRALASLRLALGDPRGATELLPTITVAAEDLPPEDLSPEDRLLAARMHLGLGDPGRARRIVRPLRHQGVGPRLTVLALRVEAAALGYLGDHEALRLRRHADRIAQFGGFATPVMHRRPMQPERPRAARTPEPTASPIEATQPLEGMTDRELDVLRRLPHCSNREIADDLCVSVNTVKTHLKGIYRKLEAPSRDAAAEQARRLGLI
jgi:LuxR family transcriptional regulator, maltose regulon positive regulatory protein